jgi:hypothetical protein
VIIIQSISESLHDRVVFALMPSLTRSAGDTSAKSMRKVEYYMQSDD